MGRLFSDHRGQGEIQVPDGESIQITTSGAGTRSNTRPLCGCQPFLIVTRYDSYLYHINEFPEWLERHDGKVIPLRSTLQISAMLCCPAVTRSSLSSM